MPSASCCPLQFTHIISKKIKAQAFCELYDTEFIYSFDICNQWKEITKVDQCDKLVFLHKPYGFKAIVDTVTLTVVESKSSGYYGRTVEREPNTCLVFCI